MRRLLATTLLLAALAAFAVLAGGAAGDDAAVGKYTVELDNAFGLVEGGDLKVAGVRAGTILSLDLDPATNRALIGIEITENGFGSLRTDVRCEARPQSLIGEYFLDCLPGTAATELPKGGRVPVEQTASTVSPDLVNNILRKPYRERLSIILGELGAGVAGNAKNLNEAVRRASPALRETDRVLEILARQNRVLADLVKNADTVIGDLSGNRKDVVRWVLEARDTASASAERRVELAEGFRRLPGFLEELEPTMRELGAVAREQRPVFANLRASAPQLKRLFDQLGPFADASRPAFRALGKASVTGRSALTAAKPVISQLKTAATGVPELGKNLAMILEHLDDRDWAVEPDPRSPGGKGYTGLESLLTYVYDQTLSVNVFDSTQHYLKVAVFESDCANYADIQRLKSEPDLEANCGARVGPNGPGINFPDPTKKAGEGDARRAREKTDRGAPTVGGPSAPAFREPEVQKAVEGDKLKLPNVLPPLPEAPQVDIPPLPRIDPFGIGGRNGARNRQPSRATQTRLLDYLLGR